QSGDVVERMGHRTRAAATADDVPGGPRCAVVGCGSRDVGSSLSSVPGRSQPGTDNPLPTTMPTYVYRVIQSAGPEQTFEVQQSIHDPPLTHHPETGQPVERVPLAPIIG